VPFSACRRPPQDEQASRSSRSFCDRAIVAIAISIVVAGAHVQLPLELNHVEWQHIGLRLVIVISIFKPRVLANTLTACIWMAGGFVAYYSVNALFATHLQKDLHLAPGLVATPIFFANLGLFLSTCGWGWWADRFGRRSAIIIPALIALPLAPLLRSAPISKFPVAISKPLAMPVHSSR
jgi:hypothetical protein